MTRSINREVRGNGISDEERIDLEPIKLVTVTI